MLENHCDCKPKNIELVQQVKDNMPLWIYQIFLK